MISPETLRRFSFFAGVDPALLKEIAMLGEEVSVQAGEWIFHQGDPAEALYIILEGTVDLKMNLDEAGTRQVDACTLVEGDIVGWSALVEPHIYTLRAAAASPTRLAKLDGAGLRNLMARDPATGYWIMQRLAQVLAKRLTNMRVRFASFIA